MFERLFDVLLAITLVWSAWRVLATHELFTAVVHFIVFGLLMTLVWTRLQAPDVALAEAVIGAGLTGVLLLDTVGRLGSDANDETASNDRSSNAPIAVAPGRFRRFAVGRALAALCVLALGFGLTLAVLDLPTTPTGLAVQIEANMELSGVSHPVTAILLNFRGYDTLLEVGVLLLAVLAVLSVQRAPDLSSLPAAPPAGPILAWLVRLVVPALVLMAGYLLVLGSYAPGGAFQAGAILGVATVLLLLASRRSIIALPGWALRGGLLAGFGLFLSVAVATVAGGGALLQYPLPWASDLILLIETAVSLSTAVTLTALYAGAKLTDRAAGQSDRPDAYR